MRERDEWQAAAEIGEAAVRDTSCLLLSLCDREADMRCTIAANHSEQSEAAALDWWKCTEIRAGAHVDAVLAALQQAVEVARTLPKGLPAPLPPLMQSLARTGVVPHPLLCPVDELWGPTPEGRAMTPRAAPPLPAPAPRRAYGKVDPAAPLLLAQQLRRRAAVRHARVLLQIDGDDVQLQPGDLARPRRMGAFDEAVCDALSQHGHGSSSAFDMAVADALTM
eukprot:TRINITY_DN28667_c0_g1_i3.p3 TRINITY_DN28667_c0_g1~~TRINITY_DN28667_c0_g1_i3.p3  ORF type:complete len:223 (+),score=45.26 TRINITY_DN28667_c0_g1_i3:1275-1943(+)